MKAESRRGSVLERVRLNDTNDRKVLDDAMARGQNFVLSHHVTDISKETGWFELNYLLSKGYKLNEERTPLIPPPPPPSQ